MRTLILLALLLIPVQACGWGVVHYQEVVVAGGGCSSTASITPTEGTSSNKSIDGDNRTYIGGLWVGADIEICNVEVYSKINLGDPSTLFYKVEVYSPDGTALGTLKGASDLVDGDVFTETSTWHPFEFTTPVTITNGDIIVITTTTQATYNPNVAVFYFAESTNLGSGTWRADKTRVSHSTANTVNFKIYPTE